VTLVLVVSNTQDIHVKLVTDRLNAAGHEVVRFDTDRVGDGCSVSFVDDGPHSRPQLIVNSVALSTCDVGSVWWRRPEAIKTRGDLQAEAAKFAQQEWTAAVHGVLRTIDALWVSHPEALRLANHKILQLQLARAVGLMTPTTCVSNDPATIRTFCERHRYHVIAKLVGAGPPRVEPPALQYMVFTAPVRPPDLASDAALAAAPAIYQEYIEKDHELRVTIVGDQVYACAIESQATTRTTIDWRRYDLDRTPHHATQLDPRVRDACLELARRLNLAFAAIDLVVTPGGDVVFLEINPNGQWGWIEEMTGLPIAQALADLLAGG